MKMKIVLLFLHLVITILSIVNAVNANNNGSMICWIVAAVCWGACFVFDIVELVLKRND